MVVVSPIADRHPELAERVNVGRLKNIIRAIESQPGASDRIRVVTVGTIVQSGDRLPPIHLIRVGDPMCSSVFDYYSITRIKATPRWLRAAV